MQKSVGDMTTNIKPCTTSCSVESNDASIQNNNDETQIVRQSDDSFDDSVVSKSSISASPKCCGDDVVALIERAMSTNATIVDGESKLAQILLVKERKINHICIEDVLVASVMDMMNLQHNLYSTECELNRMRDRNASLISDKIELQSELI